MRICHSALAPERGRPPPWAPCTVFWTLSAMGSLGQVIVINSRRLMPKGFAPSEARYTESVGKRPGSSPQSSSAQIWDIVCGESPRSRQGHALARPFSSSEGGVSS